jgi:hypothetical protein
MRRLAIAAVLCLLCVRPAHADEIDVQVKQLGSADSYKLRLSAALSLAKTHDERAIAAMVRALGRDRATTIRQVAALSLGKMIDSSTRKALRTRAIAALERAASKDDADKVRTAAARALKQLSSLRAKKGPAVFVNVDRPKDLSKKLSRKAIAELETVLATSIDRAAPDFGVRWPGGGLPTRAELRRSGTQGFFVGATVSRIEVVRSGGRSEIRCSVSIRVNPWEGRDGKEKWKENEAASCTGNAKVIGASNKTGVAGAISDCIVAVTEEIIAKQVVPFIKRLAR